MLSAQIKGLSAAARKSTKKREIRSRVVTFDERTRPSGEIAPANHPLGEYLRVAQALFLFMLSY